MLTIFTKAMKAVALNRKPGPNAMFVLLLLLLISQVAFSQEPEMDFYRRSLSVTNTGMMVLGGWAVANIATGAYGWSQFDGQQKYFHQMNFFWNTVNLGIAGYALYNNAQTDFGLFTEGEGVRQHLRTERILLINNGLNLGYIGTGMFLRHRATRNEKRVDLFRGYGNSLILQGGFLFLFDSTLYLLLRNQRLQFLEETGVSVISGFNHIGVSVVF